MHRSYWEKRYSRNYHLELLVTHPAYRRRGAGTKLISWGVEGASKFEAHVGVESSEMGFPLYLSLGFELREERFVQVENDAETLGVKVMLLSYAGEK